MPLHNKRGCVDIYLFYMCVHADIYIHTPISLSTKVLVIAEVSQIILFFVGKETDGIL